MAFVDDTTFMALVLFFFKGGSSDAMLYFRKMTEHTKEPLFNQFMAFKGRNQGHLSSSEKLQFFDVENSIKVLIEV